MAIGNPSSYVDVLIVGAGPAGLMLATQLSKLKLNVRIIDKAAHPVLRGHADGLQCRTGEVFHALDVGTRFEEEACECAETVTYTQDSVTGKLVETARQADTLPGTSLARHVLLGQDRVEAIFLEAMKKNNNVEVDRLLKPTQLEVDADVEQADASAYPIHVTLQRLPAPTEIANGDITSGLYRSNLFANGTNGTNGHAEADEELASEIVHCKFLVGCDGAHSWVRKQLGFEMRGDSANIFWGCFDAIIETDLPTIRTKNLINLTHGEGVRMIPREKGLVRVYTQMGTVKAGERVDRSQVTIDKLMARTKEALYPYKLDFRRIDWYSCYEVGQRLCDTFSKYNRIFIAGDACHTHSPRAGQGMNVSMMDTFNLGWKLASVLRRQASPEILRTYQSERRAVASDLIGMHGVWSEINAKVAEARSPVEIAKATEEFRQAGLRMAKFVSGTGVAYMSSVLVQEAGADRLSPAKGLKVGSHFENHQVVCVSNLHAVQLQRRLKADGRWRIILFPGDIEDASSHKRFEEVAAHLNSKQGPVRKYTKHTEDSDSVIECLTVVAGSYRHAQSECLHWPEVLRPIRGELRVSAFDTVFADCPSYHNGHGHAYEGYGIEESVGCIVVTRPDQYVAQLLRMDEYRQIGVFFGQFMQPAE